MTGQDHPLIVFTAELPPHLKEMLWNPYTGWRGLFDALCSEFENTTPKAKINFIREIMASRNVSFERIVKLYYDFTMSRPEWEYRAHGLFDALYKMAEEGCTEALQLLRTSEWPEIIAYREAFEKHEGRISTMRFNGRPQPN